MAPSVFFIVGLIPAIFLAFGIFMMKKNEDFSSVETTAKQFKGYVWLGLIGCLIGSLYNIYQYAHDESYLREYAFKDAVAFLVACAVPLAYLAFVDLLFLLPLRAGSEWIPYNGIFSKNSKPPTHLNININININSEIDIIKGERQK